MSSFPVDKKDNKAASVVANRNIEKIDSSVLGMVETTLDDIDSDITEIQSYMDVMSDQMISAPAEVGFALALARFAELKLSSRKQKNELLKTMLAYKSSELSSRVRKPGSIDSSLDGVLAGLGIGALAAASAGKLNINGVSNTPKSVSGDDFIEVDHVDNENVEVIIEDPSKPSYSEIIRGK